MDKLLLSFLCDLIACEAVLQIIFFSFYCNLIVVKVI